MYRWVVAFLLAVVPAPLLAQWQVAETPHFRLHADLPERQLAARAAVLEDFHALLERATGRSPAPDAPPLDVFLVDSMADASPWRPVPEGIAGYYRADTGRISAVALEDGQGRLTAQQLLLHEYAHHFLLGSSRLAYPAWYVEGFAEYFATAAFTADSIRFGEPGSARTAALTQREWLPLERLLARDPATARGEDAALFYAQSWLLAHYMFRAPEMRGRLAAYLKAFAAGEDPVAAFRRTVDPDLEGFQQKLRRYLDSGATYTRFSRPRSTETNVRLTRLSPAAGALLLRLVALEHGPPAGRGPEVLAEVRRLALPLAGDPLADRALALAELQGGAPAEAGRLLDQLLTLSPRDPDLLRWRAQAAKATRSADGIEAARAYLVRAFNAAPTDWRTLHAYARLYRNPAAPLPDTVLPVLLKAYALAPQVTEVVLDTALALSNAGRMPEAAAVLEPLAFAPHGGRAAELAQRMLQKARAGDQAGLLAEISEMRRQQIGRISAVQSR